MRPQQRKDEWQAKVSGQKTSGESVRGYCRKRGINEKSFYNWRRRLGPDAQEKREAFVEVQATAGQVLVIQTPVGYRIEVPQGAESGYVGKILKELTALR